MLGEPFVAIARGLPPQWRRRLGQAERLLTGAGRTSKRWWWSAGWFVVFVGSFWMWHIPALYNAALRNDALHSLQHATFLGAALGLWWCAVGRHARRTLSGVALLFGTLLQGTWGGAMFVFARDTYYEPYRTSTQPWGLTPVEDISLGGVIMWIAGLVFVVGTVALLGTWLAAMERRDRPASGPLALPDVGGGRPGQALSRGRRTRE